MIFIGGGVPVSSHTIDGHTQSFQVGWLTHADAYPKTTVYANGRPGLFNGTELGSTKIRNGTARYTCYIS